MKFRSLIFSILFLIFLLTSGCLRQDSNQMGLGEWRGVSLDSGEEVRFQDLPAEVLALNVYGLNCPPCWKEIPALNRIGERLAKDSRFSLLMVVDPLFILENSGDPKLASNSPDSDTKPYTNPGRSVLSAEEWDRVVLILKEEKKVRNIQVPIYIMKPPFRVSPNSFITGTPETILVTTRPWNIFYNFIGSVSEKSDIASIDSDPKVKFMISKMGARGL